MIDEVKARVEREFSDIFESRFNQLEQQLKEKEKIALEAKKMLEEIQDKQAQPAPPQLVIDDSHLRESKDLQEKALSELKIQQ